MMKPLLTYILFFAFLTAFSKRPTFPYHFYAPDFENILPFSKSELQIFKTYGINRIEAITADLRTIYTLNEQGQLITEEKIWTKSKNDIVISTTIHKYNDKGQLTVRHTSGKYDIFYDSIFYDDKGRLNHYYSYRKPLRGKKKFQKMQIHYKLQLLISDDNKVVLVDSSLNDVRYYTLNNDNEVR